MENELGSLKEGDKMLLLSCGTWGGSFELPADVDAIVTVHEVTDKMVGTEYREAGGSFVGQVYYWKSDGRFAHKSGGFVVRLQLPTYARAYAPDAEELAAAEQHMLVLAEKEAADAEQREKERAEQGTYDNRPDVKLRQRILEALDYERDEDEDRFEFESKGTVVQLTAAARALGLEVDDAES